MRGSQEPVMNLPAWPARTTLVFLGAATAAWAVTVDRMRGMDAGPGTDLGGLGWFLGVWAAMMAAMMLPSAVPAAVAVTRASRALPAALFGVGYLAVWTAFGVVAYALFRVVTSFDFGRFAWDRDGPYAAGAVIVLAGIYELTPLKEQLLRRCSSPHDPGERGALRAGIANGLYCVGCCLGLMAVLVRARRDERVLDGGDRRGDLRREGVPEGTALDARRRDRPDRPWALGRSLAFDRSDADRAWAVALHGDGDAITERRLRNRCLQTVY